MTNTTNTATVYTITNTMGAQGPRWRDTYATQADAAESLRKAMGWDAIILSDSYCTGEDSDACNGYETQAECDEDGDGAYAPRIVATRKAVRS